MTIRVLLIDDDADLLEVASKYLIKEDPTFEIDTAISAEEGLNVFHSEPFDVIVCDYEMPTGMNGLELLELLRSKNFEIPYIIFTGRGREEVAISALNLGADFYITKGIDPKSLYAELAHTIRTVVSHRRAKLALEESDSRFRASFEDAAIGMAVVSLDLEIIEVNESLCEMLGYAESELISKNLEEFIHPDEQGNVPIAAFNILRGESVEPVIERRFLKKNGDTVWTRTTSSLTRDSKNNPLYFVTQIQDISERMFATKALQDSETRFRGAFHDASIGMALVSFDNVIMDCNLALCQMLGYTREELVGKTFPELTHPDDMNKTPEIINGTFQNGKTTIQLEKRYLHKSGHTVYTFISSSIGLDENKKPKYFVTQFQDITESKIASEALAASEANYRNLVENSLQSFAILQDGRYVFVNEPFAKTLGRTREELVNMSPNDIWGNVHPDDIEGLRERNRALEADEEIAPRHVFRYIQPDGSIRWVEGFVQEIEFDGRPALQIVEIDITDRKMSEIAQKESIEFLDALLNTISSPVFFKGINGIYQRCNMAFASKLLDTTPEHVIGKSSDIVIKRAIGMTKSDLAELDRVLINGSPDQSFEISIQSPDGIVRDYEVTRSVYRDHDGNAIGIVGVLLDITQRRMAMKNLERERLAFRIIAEAAVHSEELSMLCDEVLDSLLEVLDFDFGSIQIVNHETQCLELVAISGIKSRTGRRIKEKQPLSDDSFLSVHIANLGQLIFAPSIQDHPIAESHKDIVNKFKMKALIASPLRGASGELIGVLQLVSKKEKDLSKLDHYFFEIVSGMFATVLENKRADEALRQSESRFRSTFESIPQPAFLWELDSKGEVILSMVNQSTLELSQGTVLNYIYKPFSDLFQQNSDLLRIIRSTFRTGEPISLEQELVFPNTNLKRWVIWHSTRADENMVLLIATDITQHRQLEEMLSRQKEELSDFAHVMSHDLQGTLHNALVYAELLEDSLEKEYLLGIREMIDSAQAILKQSVTLADAGLVIGEKESVDLNKLFDEVAKREIGKLATYQRDKLPSIKCDRLKMVQIITNLLRNAIEHGKPSLIEVRLKDTPSEYKISIRNNGTQIPPENRESLFNRTFTTKTAGGLGLMIVRKLVEGHGWTVQLDENEVTSFTISIPKDDI
ncbi:MAG: PAS domain S-box protein [Candidatus Thorarchaeota archaeon]